MRSILNISLPIQLAKEIKTIVKEEGYASVSEFIRTAYREWSREREIKDTLKRAEDAKSGKNMVKADSLKDFM